MGTPKFSVPSLQSIIDSQHNVAAIYTQPAKKKSRGQKIKKSPVQIIAEKFNIRVRTPYDLNNDKEYDFFLKLKPDLVVVVAYGKIIPDKFLKIPNLLFINLHASLLPKWRGAAPVERSIMNLDNETGVTIMKITSKLDEGPYTKQVRVKIDKKTTSGELKEKLSKLGAKAIIDTVNLISKGQVKFAEQDHSNSTYAKKIDKLEARINWNDDAENIIAKVNAFNPSPGAWFKYNKQRLKVLKAEEIKLNGTPGEVLDNKLTIATGSNSIKILEIQKEGKNKMDTKNFLIGNKIEKGVKFT